jgi:hypothetical protein
VLGYGVSLTLRANDLDGLEFLLASLPGCWKVSMNGHSDRVYSLVVERRRPLRYALYRDDVELVHSADPERVIESLVGSVGFYVAEHSRQRTFIHAGAVGWRGHAVLLPGRQTSGKTTLTAALVRAGASYLSDDYAPLDDRGRVHPFPRPLSVRQENGLSAKLTPVESIGGVQETRALPVGLVVFAPYADVKHWRPRRIPPGKGVLELLAHTVSAQTRPREAIDRLGRVAASAVVLKGGRGEADDAARVILKRLTERVGAA